MHEVKRRIVAICGTAGSSRAEIMAQPAEVELWGLNLSYLWMPRWDRWFELHDPTIYTGVFSEAHRAWLRAADVPVYMQQRHEDIPSSVAFPADAVTEAGALRPYLTSSIAYMLALAVHEGVDEIRLLGANMATGSEYAYQRAACEYWIGVAEARGIRVYLPANCPLTKGPRYGAVGASGDLVRGIVDVREAVKLQIDQTYQGLVEAVRASLERGSNVDLREELRKVDLTIAGCTGGLQVLDKLTEGQVALTVDQAGLMAVEQIEGAA